VAHMPAEVDLAIDPEGHVLEVATGIDISGRPIAVPSGLRAQVLAAFPRAGLPQEFTGCFADRAARKPAGTAAAGMRSGLADGSWPTRSTRRNDLDTGRQIRSGRQCRGNGVPCPDPVSRWMHR
jgi:hypothetical protein